ncbi:family 78 glycoside hydrolase catalytic domain [Haloferula sp.]|uniref:family 78 glycoside hydrolase catalytic domain n=1 Tax=Haloferula sp. TaxID=2497595 RepID=UPI003C740A23
MIRHLLLSALLVTSLHGFELTKLQVEHQTNPVGLDDRNPRFQWQLVGESPGLAQSAYRILVSSSADKLAADDGDLWDSGKKTSSDAHAIYAGKPLPSSSHIHWKVQTWNSKDEVSPWSANQTFLTALIGSEPTAPWISFKDETPFHKDRATLHLPPPRYYRKSINAEKKITKAIAYASALGIYELHLNGKRIGDTYFAPGWTNYDLRAYYNAYDLTADFQQGANTLGAIVADGWYAGYLAYGKLVGYGPYKTGRNIYGKTPSLMVQLQLTYEDGSTETVTTDPSWKVSTGPEFEADFLMGEGYDARKELGPWSTNNYDASNWESAILAEDNGSHKHVFIDRFKKEEQEFGFTKPPVLQAYPAQPVRIIEEMPAKSVTELKPGTFIFDLGQNIAGLIRLQVTGKEGQKIVIRYGEMLHPDGRLMTENLRAARSLDTYICKGDPNGESWTPRFTSHGFQFVEVSGLDAEPPLSMVTGLVMHSDTPFSSGFECSDPSVNKVFENAVWTQRGNWIDLPTDCPQRDERMGWTGDAQIYAASAAYHADVAAFFKKWLRELEDSMTPEGYYPSYAPYPFGHGGAIHATAWSDAGVIVPHAIWKATGNPDFFVNHWPAMSRYMEARRKHDPELKGTAFGAPWGDWLNVNDETPHEYIDLCYFTLISRQMAEMADAQALDQEAEKYRDWVATLRKNFRDNHLQEDGSIKPTSQSAYVLALDCGLLTDSAERKAAGAHLAQLIQSKSGPKNTGMTTGFLGTKPLLPVLTDTGNLDLAVRLIQSRKFPSWGYEVKNGATTIWERWNSYTEEHGFGGADGKMNAAMNSFSHYAFGAVTEWMMSTLAGIAPAEPGYSKILLHPHFPSKDATDETEAISWVKAYHDSPYGRISVSWKRNDDDSLSYEATVPPNTTAELILPETSPWTSENPPTKSQTLLPGSHRITIK